MTGTNAYSCRHMKPACKTPKTYAARITFTAVALDEPQAPLQSIKAHAASFRNPLVRTAVPSDLRDVSAGPSALQDQGCCTKDRPPDCSARHWRAM